MSIRGDRARAGEKGIVTSAEGAPWHGQPKYSEGVHAKHGPARVSGPEQGDMRTVLRVEVHPGVACHGLSRSRAATPEGVVWHVTARAGCAGHPYGGQVQGV